MRQCKLNKKNDLKNHQTCIMLQYLHNKIASSAFVEKDTMEVWVNGIVVETAVSMVFQSL